MPYGLTMEQLAELSDKPEPLLPELVDSERTWPDGRQQIFHPYIIFEGYNPGCYAVVNHWYKMKRDKIENALAAGDWGQAFLFIEKPYHLQSLERYADRMSDAEFWELFGDCYRQMEFLSDESDLLERLTALQRPGRESMMDDAERDALKAMPETITVYRGYQKPKYRLGWSWTIDNKQARWFAQRFQSPGSGFIVSGKVRKSDVIAYWTGRNESEILTNPANVFDVK